MKRRLACAATCFGALLTGCNNPWKDAYQPYVSPPPLAEGEEVTVREVPWQRMEAALREQEEILAASDVHWEEWSDDERRDANAKLLKALQITDAPESVTLVGVSAFRTTDRVRPWDGELQDFARERGAHYAIWSDRYLGKAETIVTRTIWSDSIDSIDYEDMTGEDRRASRFRSGSADVPVVIEKDETGYTAFFIRVDR